MNHDRCRDLEAGEEVITTGATLVWNNDGTWTVSKFHDTAELPYLASDESGKVRLNDNGIPYVEQSIESGEFYDPMYPEFVECHDEYVVLRIYDEIDRVSEEHTVTYQDVKRFGLIPGSGMACLGTIMGDHGEITSIYEDVVDYFMQEHPEHFTPEERERWKGMQ